jgi:hypothetical protein
MEARNRGGIGLSYRPVRLHRLAEYAPWNRFLCSLKALKFGLRAQEGNIRGYAPWIYFQYFAVGLQINTHFIENV